MYNSNKNELEILKYWDEHECFGKSVKQRPENKPYVFYDGPPFATGLPHYGHIVASLMKDVVPRYWTMRGYRVERKWGWDCHGLPIENIIEKDLNLNSKKDIENFGVDKFNEACNATVLKYASEWKKTIKRMGRWVDMNNDYKTMDTGYMESAWWVFKELWNKGLVYKGHKAMHICPRCVTPLSNFEVTQGYKDVKDLSVIAKFPITDKNFLDQFCGGVPTSFIAWTTTPWSIPTTMGLAVGPDFDYVIVKIGGEQIICARARLEYTTQHLEPGSFAAVKELKGREMLGVSYNHPFAREYGQHKDVVGNSMVYRTHGTDYVSVEDGTGIVTINGAFGEIDYSAAKKIGLPIMVNVKMDGTYTEDMGALGGRQVKPKEDPSEMDVEIIKLLAARGFLYRKEKYTHSYPHCWRCDTPLLNYLTDCWFIRVTALKDQLLKNNEAIHWVPEHFKQGRFGDWLDGARDWAVSRNRFWGNPLPVWESSDGDAICVGSATELARLSGQKMTRVIFLRHGESEVNVNRIKSSARDKYPLTDTGRRAVEELARNFTDKIDTIISSPVLRARETAEIFARHFDRPVVTDDLIREYDYGHWEDQKKDDLYQLEGYRTYKRSIVNPSDKFKHHFGEVGESRVEITERVREFLQKLVKEHAGETVLVVSHGGINASMTAILEGLDYDKFFAEEKIAYNGLQYYYLNESGQRFDLHKQFVDKIEIVKDGKTYRRVPEVLDCWFESGSMPYGQMHYPFENRAKFEAGFPAQFIAEGQDQTRGWFYTLHVLATALTAGSDPSIPKDQSCPAFNNVIVNGIVLAEDGKKMSKRLKNYPEPDLMLEKYGADAMRYYLVTAPVMAAEALNFAETGVREMYNKLVNTLWNVVEFYGMYAGDYRQPSDIASDNILDKWILAKLSVLIKDVTEGMNNYELARASRPIVEFVTELSQWYVRRSRDRFKGDDTKDKANAVTTLRHTLLILSKLMAPFTPFISEKIYLELTAGREDAKESVHLESWPQYNELIDAPIIESMMSVREVVECGLAARASAGIKVKQPLLKMLAPIFGDKNDRDQYVEIIKDELNVKDIEIINSASEMDEKRINDMWEVKESQRVFVAIYKKITPALKQEGMSREIVRAINQLRKEMKLTISDEVTVAYESDDSDILSVFEKFGDEIKKSVLAKNLAREKSADAKEVEAGGKKIFLSVRKSG